MVINDLGGLRSAILADRDPWARHMCVDPSSFGCLDPIDGLGSPVLRALHRRTRKKQ